MSHHGPEDFMSWVMIVRLVGITSGAQTLGGIWSHALCASFPSSWCGIIFVFGSTAIILGSLVWLPLFWSLLSLRR